MMWIGLVNEPTVVNDHMIVPKYYVNLEIETLAEYGHFNIIYNLLHISQLTNIVILWIIYPTVAQPKWVIK